MTDGDFNDVKRHVAGKGHQKHYKEVTQNHTMESFAAQHVSDLSTKNISSEVAMCNFIAQHNLSFSTADHLTDLLPKMFPDSKIVAGYACKRTKTTAIICDALGPHFLRPVVDTAESLSFSLLCDESNERGDTEKLLMILVRIFEEAHGQVTARHLETVGIVDFSANGIFTAIQDTLLRHGLAFERIVSFASNMCNVLKGARGGVIAKIRQEQRKIIDIHCNCHVLNLAVKSAVKALPLKVDELLVDTFYQFHHSVKRIVSLQEYADFCNFQFKIVLCHSETRWLSLGRSVSRTLEMWEPLCAYFTSHPDVEKNGKVKTIAAHLNRPSTKVYLCFLSEMLRIFDKVNVALQSFFAQPGEIRAVEDVLEVDYTDPGKQVFDEELFMGDSALALICHQSDNEGEEPEMSPAYDHMRAFHLAFVVKLIKAFPFNSKALQLLSFLDPEKVLSIPL